MGVKGKTLASGIGVQGYTVCCMGTWQEYEVRLVLLRVPSEIFVSYQFLSMKNLLPGVTSTPGTPQGHLKQFFFKTEKKRVVIIKILSSTFEN